MKTYAHSKVILLSFWAILTTDFLIQTMKIPHGSLIMKSFHIIRSVLYNDKQEDIIQAVKEVKIYLKYWW